MTGAEKLIVALDLSNLSEAEKLVKVLSGTVKIFKVGKELFTSAGPKAIQMIQAHSARVFLDLKFHDIPNTVGAACEAAVRLRVFMLNVHVTGGKPMLFKAVQSVHQTAGKEKINPPYLLGVTVLTSMTDADLKDVGIKKKLKRQVEDLSVLAKNCGLDGVVASGQEIDTIRKAAGKDFLIVTPGVRPIWAAHGDQRRVITPKEAIQKGADFIVVGRPITEHPKPKIAAERILDEMGVKE
jgi:orotidine-5'-phosphate decarboxylase